VWLLNNDAIAAADTLSPLTAALKADMRIAFAGSVIMDARRQDEVQCFGVRYFKWLGVAKMLFKGRVFSGISPEEMAAARPHFQHGASLLVRMAAIRKIGLLDERFFLYSEEHDWQERAVKAGMSHLCVPESKVFHLGSMSTARSRHLFFYYYCRSSAVFSRKHHPGLTAVVATIMLTLITLIRTRLHARSMAWALKGIREAWKIRL
jgi:GT2 family glycosyltransferase